jgi:hypothetical protein
MYDALPVTLLMAHTCDSAAVPWAASALESLMRGVSWPLTV